MTQRGGILPLLLMKQMGMGVKRKQKGLSGSASRRLTNKIKQRGGIINDWPIFGNPGPFPNYNRIQRIKRRKKLAHFAKTQKGGFGKKIVGKRKKNI